MKAIVVRTLIGCVCAVVGIPIIMGGIHAARTASIVNGDASDWAQVSVGQTGAKIRMPKKPRVENIQSPSGRIPTYLCEVSTSAWAASYEPLRLPGQTVDRAFAVQARQGILTALRARPNVEAILSAGELQQRGGAWSFVVEMKNNLGAPGKTGYFSALYVLIPDWVVTLNHGTKRQHSRAQAEKYFETLSITEGSLPTIASSNAISPNATSTRVRDMASSPSGAMEERQSLATRQLQPDTPSPATNSTSRQLLRSQKDPRVSYQQLRRNFETQLLVLQKAPQDYERRRPGRGIEQVTYESDGMELIAFESRGDATAAQPRPALLFLHGGFACDPNELKVVQPFLDAGFVGFAPTYRGENGNPGNFSLFLNESTDAANAARWLAERPYVDPSRVYCIGHSAGGAIAALLSVIEDVPLQSTASVGGIYTPDNLKSEEFLPTPFKVTDDEVRLRVLFGNTPDLQRTHYAYVGRRDFALFSNLGKLRGDAIHSPIGREKIKTDFIDGDHFTSFDVGLMKYLKICQGEE